MSIPRLVLGVAACCALVACSAMEDPSVQTSTPRSLAKWVLVSPATPIIAPGQSLTLDVEMQDASGRDLSGQPEVWSTSDSSIATVSSDGTVTAHALGLAKIYVASGTQVAYSEVSVSNAAPAPRWVSVTPATAQVSVRATLALFASVTDASGHLVSNVPVTWTTSNPAYATVDTTGGVTGVSPGTVNIIAHAGSNQATTQLHVVAAIPATQPPTAPAPPPPPPPAPAPPPPPPQSPPPASGTLYSGYSATSPHWPHIRTMMTDFYYAWTGAERAWAGQHYDDAMSGTTSAWQSANPTVNHLPYTLEWTTIIPGPTTREGLASGYYNDMIAWFHTHPQYNRENALLHKAGVPHDSAGRLVITIWGSKRWVINPADPGARQYQVERYQRITANEQGAFVDEAASNMTGYLNGNAEFPTISDFEAPQTATFAAIKAGMGNKIFMINTAEYQKPFDRANAIAAGAVHMEGLNNALSSGAASNWTWEESLLNQGVFVDIVTLYSTPYVNTLSSTFPHGNSATSAQRMKLWELASYYMVVPSNPANLTLQLENEWSLSYSSMWIRAQEANIGHPLGARVQASRGTDPLGQNYAVYTRDMDRALIVMRINQGWGSHSYQDGSAVTIPLPTTDQWVPLNADGTLGSPVTSITLRNVEAAILIKKSRL